MPFARPSLPTLIERNRADVESRLPGTEPRLRRSVLGALGRSVAGEMHGLYGYLDWLSRQIVPSTAEAEILERHASWWGIDRNPAAAATGNVEFSGSDGAIIPAGTTLQRSDGIEYATDAEATISGGTATAAVTASAGGQDTSAVAGVSLQLTSPISGVQSSATVASGGLTGGADEESDDDLRDRLRKRVQQPPQGGAVSDYEQWALEVEGVTRVWVMPRWNGIGTVGVYFTRDDDAAIIPDAAEVQAVQDYLDDLRPVTADVTAYAPTEAAQDMTIQLAPNDSATQAAVEAELADLFRREANVEDGNGAGTILISHIREAISTATGETDHVLVSPTSDITLNPGELATLGAITWQAIP
ncbi:baseplate J/gp47 family protein [Guyparkeria sp. SB14A]|uniref:baseplate J/gp47 family protein n=1 Tax=Guyparkeria sp. SB14A TaxID=2571147 RepID=UPI0010AC5051|nr:baseplate J/gp47 family protein [Guyparkeria sp. SB14A]TKA91801.1 baseplate J/gp47 family protein [Guyparkeria sp. SB14A]